MIGASALLSRSGQLALNNLLQYRQLQSPQSRSSTARHYLDIRFQDEAGRSLLPLIYSLTSQQKPLVVGKLDSAGRLQRYYLTRTAQYCVRLRVLTKLQWDRAEATFDDEVFLLAQFSDSAMLGSQSLTIYAQYFNNRSELVQFLSAPCQRGKIKQAWRIKEIDNPRFPVKGYYYILQQGEQVFRSPLLKLRHKLDLQLHLLARQHGRVLKFKFFDGSSVDERVTTNGSCRSLVATAGVYQFALVDCGAVFAE